MAIIKLGAPVTGIRGTVAGITYSANKAGPYARPWSRPSNQRSPMQTSQRSTLAAVAGAWRDETAADRTAWDLFAADPAQELFNSLGESYYASGFAWYCKINIRLTLMARALRSAPPITARPAAPTIWGVFPTQTGAGGTCKIQYVAAMWAGYDMVLDMAVTQGIGALNAFSNFYQVERTQAPGNDSEWFNEWTRSKLGYIIAGNTYHVRGYRQTDDGVRSAAGSKSGIAV